MAGHWAESVNSRGVSMLYGDCVNVPCHLHCDQCMTMMGPTPAGPQVPARTEFPLKHVRFDPVAIFGLLQSRQQCLTLM